jgi:peptide/nickel transport system permease protein
MFQYLVRRLLVMIPTLIAISIVSFVLIQLPPGDFLTTYAATLASQGDSATSAEQLNALREAYGLGQPIYVQYWKWISSIIFHGDFGQSLEWKMPVADLLWQRMGATLGITVSTLLLTWLLAIPIGIYSATHQYSKGDYFVTFLGFLGLGIPSFMIALILMWVAFRYLGLDVGGLFSAEYRNAPWSVGKFFDLMRHAWIPLVIIGLEGTAGLIRTMRANLLDELNKPYVIAGRARGLEENQLIREYPVRVALNPFVSTAGFALPGLIDGATIVGIVLSLPIYAPLLLKALQSQDMYLAGAFILIIAALTIIGVLISDLVLAWIDPRIRYN